LISQKCQYALRALFELSRRYGDGPVRIADIAEAQDIPPRFLEVILSQLKQGGFAVSQRGARGGYMLARPPDELTVGEIIRFVEGPVGPVTCAGKRKAIHCRFQGNCVFLPMWERVREAMSSIYDTTTFQDLVDECRQKVDGYVLSYTI